VIFRVLLVGFGLFRLGAARAPFFLAKKLVYRDYYIEYCKNCYSIYINIYIAIYIEIKIIIKTKIVIKVITKVIIK